MCPRVALATAACAPGDSPRMDGDEPEWLIDAARLSSRNSAETVERIRCRAMEVLADPLSFQTEKDLARMVCLLVKQLPRLPSG